MYSAAVNDEVFDLYAVGEAEWKEDSGTSVPYMHIVHLHGPQGEIVRVRRLSG